jgi:hypothetical protein
MTIRIKDWGKFQHFKDRTPPWVKLYRDILDDPDWHELDGTSAKVLTMLWLIASEDDTHTGALPDIRKLAFRLRIEESKLNQILSKLSHWLIHDDIEAITERYQHDAPETETETEKETKKKATVVAPPDGVSESIWNDFVKHRKAKKAQVTQVVIDQLKKEAEKAGWPIEDVFKEMILRNWVGFKATWVNNTQFAFQKPTFAQQAADIARVTVPGSTDPDPALQKIAEDRKKAVPMPDHIKAQINSVLRKVG